MTGPTRRDGSAHARQGARRDARRPGGVLWLSVLVLLALPLAGCLGGLGGGGGPGGPTTTAPGAGGGNGTPAGGQAPPGVDPTDLRPHVHDRWHNPATGEALTEIVLVEGTFTIEAYNASDPTTQNPGEVLNSCDAGGPDPMAPTRMCFGQTHFRPGTWSNGDNKVVPPATARMETTVTFDAADFGGMKLYYQDRDPDDTAAKGSWEDMTNESLGGPLAPGGDTRELPVGERESDDGHATVSAWEFRLEAHGNPHGTGNPSYGSGEVQVRIVVHRAEGPLPLEPAHPLFWGADDPPTDSYLIGHLVSGTDGFVQVGPMDHEHGGSGTPKLSGQGMAFQVPVGFEGRKLSEQSRYPDKLQGDRTEALVPPGARTLAIWVRATGATTGGLAPEVCVFGQDVPGRGFPGQQLADCQPFEDGFDAVFLHPVTDRDVDSFYVNRSTGISLSRWMFYLVIRAPEAAGGVPGAMEWTGDVEAMFFAADHAAVEVPDWARARAELGGGGDGGGGGDDALADGLTQFTMNDGRSR